MPAPEFEADELHDRIAAARPGLDAFVVAVLRARTRAELFGTGDPVRVGRYELQRHIGTGGGGAVFVAADGELAREVALKLIVAPDPELRRRALAEGQALAQLSHPNVVPVFDVGAIDERVYLVMELVKGVSLREYARTAKPAAIIRAYRQCALGLAAAHAAKLVHRDFKPDNAVIADDGRVRVIDFGLALAGLARAGTPAYMAPEQRRGEALTAAVDQYALAMSLREALGEPTGKLGRVLARASAEDPAARYASVAALEAQLARFDPSVKWRRRGLVAVPLAIAAIAYGVGSRDAESPCDDDATELADVWSPARHAELAAHFTALDTAYGRLAIERLDMLDRYAGAWIADHHAACVAHQAGELSAPAFDHRQRCFASARTQLATLAELATTVDADALAKLVAAIPELPDLASCADETTVVPPTVAQEQRARALRDRLDRARVRMQAGVDVTPELVAILADARALDYRPLVADASLLLGTAHLLAWKFEAAIEPLHAAYLEELHAGDYRDAVEAFARYAWVRSRSETPRATDDGEAVTALAEGLPKSARFAQALLHNNLGSIAIAANDVTRARTEFETSLALAKDVSGPGSVELSAALSNLALVTDDSERQQTLFAQRIAIQTTALGADHAITLATRRTAALVIRDPARARAALAPPCSRLVELHPSSKLPIAECGLHLGWLALADGDKPAARRQFALAATPLATAFLALASDDPTATEKFRALLTGKATSWSELFDAGQAEIGLGLAGDAPAFDRARDLLDRALALHPRWSPIAWRLAWLTERLPARQSSP